MTINSLESTGTAARQSIVSTDAAVPRPNYRQQVRQALTDYLSEKGINQADIAKQIGVSDATITQIINDTYGAKGDDMYRKIGAYLRSRGVAVGEQDVVWRIVATANYETIQRIADEAVAQRGIYCITGDSGYGKTTALLAIARKHAETIYVLCDYLMTRKSFVAHLAQSVGLKTDSNNTRELLEAIAAHLRSKEGATLLLDDVGKLSQTVYPIIQLLYDRCGEKNIGIVLAGMPLLGSTIKKGTKRQKLGFPELSRRIVNKSYDLLKAPTPAEISSIAASYGIVDKNALAYLREHCTEYQQLRDLVLGALRIAKGDAITRGTMEAASM